MSETLVDSSVILDVLTEDTEWFDWSSEALAEQAEQSVLVINPLIYAEVSVRFKRIEDLDEALPPSMFRRDALPWQSGFLAGKAFVDRTDDAAHAGCGKVPVLLPVATCREPSLTHRRPRFARANVSRLCCTGFPRTRGVSGAPACGASGSRVDVTTEGNP